MRVHVVTCGVDSEGADVVGVATTPEAGRAMAEADAGHGLQWSTLGEAAFARKEPGGIHYYEVTPWEVAR